jgi:DNA-binding transcriptional MerR regulator
VADERYAVGELADLGGVSRRTVRYYVHEGLIPAPLGVGRGDHYGREHLDRLLQVKALQEAGRSLDEIRQLLDGGAAAAARPAVAVARPLPREVWRRVTVAPGVELLVSGDVRLPSPARFQELAAWCRLHLNGRDDTEDDDA